MIKKLANYAKFFSLQAEPEVILGPGRQNKRLWQELWQARELLLVLSWRNITVNYKQATMGVLWAFIRPLMTMIIFTVVFGLVARMPREQGMPYSILVLTGLSIWFFISSAVSQASMGFVTDAPIILKVYLPRLVVPLSYVVAALADFAISLILLLALMAWHHIYPTWHILALPLVVIHLMVLSSAAGILLATLNVRITDFRQLTPFILQLNMYAAPVVYSSSIIPLKWQSLYFLNPVASIISAYRWCLLGQNLNVQAWAYSFLLSLVFLKLAINYFKKNENLLADKL